ncbi:MAG: NAD(P)-dependent alcohol dehydrogenase [Paracoccaceae bacterium]
MKTYAMGTRAADRDLGPVAFERRDPDAGEVAIEITHCGICHSDLHQARNDWGNTNYPCIPGHEIVGTVTSVGEGVRRFAVGDTVGVGCMVNSCQTCTPCREGDEQYCEGPKSATLTYNGTKIPDGSNTYGGYSDGIVVREEFVLRIPDAIEPQEAAPILCAGITVYDPMVRHGVGPGKRVGVAGIGGLGHMAIQIAKAMGAEVVALTRKADKAEAARALGADHVIVTEDEDQMAREAMTLDALVDTIPVEHPLDPYLSLMRPRSTVMLLGNMIGFPAFVPAPMVFHRISLAGSLIGGIERTQEVLDFCARHGIRSEVEVVGIDDVNAVLHRLEQGDQKFRSVIDMKTLKDQREAWAAKAETIPDPERGEPAGRRESA